MSFKSIFRELREMKDGLGNVSRRRSDRKHGSRPGRAHIAPEGIVLPCDLVEQGQWGNLLPELLCDIIQRVEASETSWPARRYVVACASVCRSWREITKQTVMTPEQCGLLTFPISLKQPGPRDSPIQCFIRRERATATYRLYLGLSPALSGDVSKLILVAKKVRRATGTDFIISLGGDDFSRSSNMYIGKLRSNFLGTKFTIHDSQPPIDGAISSSFQPYRKGSMRQATPRVHESNYTIGSISYELNVLRTRGPRRMHCTMQAIPSSAIQDGGTAPTPVEFTNSVSQPLRSLAEPKGKKPLCDTSSTCLMEHVESVHSARSPLILKNKAPRWHEQLQCWCLNFKGRVTVASVKNFQLVAAVEPSHNIPAAEQEKVILQFGKIGKDIFTMDYRYPLSAFQAFAICLSSFDTKPACE